MSNTNILKDFLLFNVSEFEAIQSFLSRYALVLMISYFIFELIITKFRDNPDLKGSLKRFLLVQFIILALPTYYMPVASFGFDIGDRLLKIKSRASNDGIIKHWYKIKRDISLQTKEKEASLATTIYNLIDGDSTDLVVQGGTFLLLVILLLMKVIYTAIFYGTYITLSFRALLAIDKGYERNLEGTKMRYNKFVLMPSRFLS